jgi:tetratricopeptide (TPR) repeat protein
MRLFVFLVIGVLIASAAWAETIKLVDGQEMQARVLERTVEGIKIDFAGVELTYGIDEVESIDGVPARSYEGGRVETEAAAQEDVPDDAEVRFYSGVDNARKNNFSLAFIDFTKAIELNPQLAEAYYNRGVLFSRQDAYGEAITDFTKAIELKPKYAQAYNNRAVAYYVKKEYSSALADVQKAMALGYEVNLEFVDELTKAAGQKKR